MTTISTSSSASGVAPLAFDTGRHLRQSALWTAGLTATTCVAQVIASLNDSDQAVRDSVWSDVVAVVVASLLFTGIAFGIARFCGTGPRSRQVKGVVGLSVLAFVLAPVGWWSAAPTLVAVQCVLLARLTGVAERGDGAPRAARVVATVVAVGLQVFIWSVLLFEVVG